MKFGLAFVAVASSLCFSASAFAQAAAETAAAAPIKRGSHVYSSDARRIGRVESINKAKDGTPTTVSIIAENKFVYVPVSTLSPGEKGYVSSLTREQILSGK